MHKYTLGATANHLACLHSKKEDSPLNRRLLHNPHPFYGLVAQDSSFGQEFYPKDEKGGDKIDTTPQHEHLNMLHYINGDSSLRDIPILVGRAEL